MSQPASLCLKDLDPTPFPSIRSQHALCSAVLTEQIPALYISLKKLMSYFLLKLNARTSMDTVQNGVKPGIVIRQDTRHT